MFFGGKDTRLPPFAHDGVPTIVAITFVPASAARFIISSYGPQTYAGSDGSAASAGRFGAIVSGALPQWNVTRMIGTWRALRSANPRAGWPKTSEPSQR